ncbi:MAG: ABC transporter permease [Dorea sp.]|nr:ABC transporter permease [Dorea sp.]
MLRYELKKFFSKTVNRAILIVVILIAAAYSFLAAGSMRYTDANGENPDGIGKIAAGRKLAADKNQWKGELTAERIADVVQSYKGLRRQYQGEVPDNEYGKTVQSYWDILNFTANVYTMEPNFLPDVIDQISEEDVNYIYDIYGDNLQKAAEEYGETSEQEEFIKEQYGKLEIPVEYEAYDSWETMPMYIQTYVIILAVVIGFMAAGIFDEEFRNHAELVFFAAKYGRSKAIRNKIAAGIITATAVYWTGVGIMTLISFGIMGTSGFHMPYQFEDPDSVYAMTQGQRYLLIVVCGYIASLLSASVTMLVTAKMRTAKVAVCIPFFMFCVMLFIARSLSDVTRVVYYTTDVLTNVLQAVKVPTLFQIGDFVILQIPFVMVLYSAVSIILLPFIYRSYSRYGLR